MTTEKRSIDNDNLSFNVSAVVVDIEGTTTSINFVKETLFPYVRENLEEYINSKWSDKELQEDVALLREQANTDATEKVEGAIDIPEGEGDEVKASVIKNVLWQMDGDRKTKALKQLQGHIWRNGYSSGKIVGHLYDDVKDCLKTWSEAGKNIYVYSSGSVEAQKLLFGNTKDGDLLNFFSGYFDTEIGPKTESASYVKIVENLKENGKVASEAKDILFLTDVLKEAQAAAEAGMKVAIVIREGNTPLPDDTKDSFPMISSFSDLTFEGNAKRRKLSHESEKVENDGIGNLCKDDEKMDVCTNDDSAVSAPEITNNSAKRISETDVSNSDDTAKTTADSVSMKSEDSAKVTPDPGNNSPSLSVKIPDLVNSGEAVKQIDTVNGNVSKESAEAVPDSVNNSNESSSLVSVNNTEKESSFSEENKIASEVSSSQGPKIENGLQVPEGIKDKQISVEKDAQKTESVANSECTVKKNDQKGTGAIDIEKAVVNGKKSKDDLSNVPDSTVETEDVEMKEVEEKETGVCPVPNKTKTTESEKENKTKEPVEIEECKEENKTEERKEEKIEEYKEEKTEERKEQSEECKEEKTEEHKEKEKIEERKEEEKAGECKQVDKIEECKKVVKTEECKEVEKTEERKKVEKTEECNEIEKTEECKEVEKTDQCNEEKDTGECIKQSKNVSEEHMEQKKTEEQVSDKSKEPTKEEASEIGMEICDKQDSAVVSDLKTEETSKGNDVEMTDKEELKTDDKLVLEKSPEDTQKEEQKQEISDAEVSKEKSDVDFEKVKSISESSMDVDNASENRVDYKAKEDSQMVPDVVKGTEKCIDDKKSHVSQNETNETNGRTVDVKKTSNVSGIDNTDNKTLVNSEAGEGDKEKNLQKANELNAEDKLVDNKVADTVVDKTDNKADGDNVMPEGMGKPKVDVNNEETSDKNKETDDKKTDKSSSTPNGTHETCKNGVNEDETNNTPNEDNIKEKTVEKIKESSTEQNGIETAGEV